jgi:hypothetical protein
MENTIGLKAESKKTFTAVQIRDEPHLCSYTIHGNPAVLTNGQKGEIRLYPAGEIVGFVIEKIYNKRAFIFSTCSGEGTHKIPGVFPEVHLLVETRSRGKTRQLLRYMNYALKNHICLNELPEDFYLRLNTMLEERKNRLQDFKNLVRRWKS